MYCVVCLQNRARDFFCPYCEPKVQLLFDPTQLRVDETVKERFKQLTMHDQKEIIVLVNKRMGSMLKAGWKVDFVLNVMIYDYVQMKAEINDRAQRGKETYPLEIPKADNYDVIGFQRYCQYDSPKEGGYVR